MFVSRSSEPWFSDYDEFRHDLKLMAKGYSIGGARMMKAMGGKMAKGNSRMNLSMLRRAAGGMGYKLTKK